MPIALVTLVDETRQWFKSAHGTDLTWTPRERRLLRLRHPGARARLRRRGRARGPPLPRQPARRPARWRCAPTPASRWSGPTRSRSAPCACSTPSPRTLGDRQLRGLRALSHQVVAQLEGDRSASPAGRGRARPAPHRRRPPQRPDASRASSARSTAASSSSTTSRSGTSSTAVGPSRRGSRAPRRSCGGSTPSAACCCPARSSPRWRPRASRPGSGEVVLEQSLRTLARWEAAPACCPRASASTSTSPPSSCTRAAWPTASTGWSRSPEPSRAGSAWR